MGLVNSGIFKMKPLFCVLFVSVSYFSCIPQPIYYSVKKTETGVDESTLTKGGLVSDSTKSGSDKTNQAASSAGALSIPLSGVILTKDKQDAMMAEIKSWMGTPYKFGMVEKGKGTDCSGFVGYVFKKVLDIDLPRQSADMYNTGESIGQKDLKFGDLVFFQNTYKGSKGASHVGIWVGDNKFAHASTTVGVTISDLSEDYYSKHYLGCKKILKK